MSEIDLSALPPSPAEARRAFLLKAIALGAGAVATSLPIAAGVATWLDPLRRKATAGGQVLVTMLGALPADGTPRRFPVVANKSDVWNKYPNVPIGAVYLRRDEAGRVEALNVTCPHAGCSVEFREDSRTYLCPCHNSRFALDGRLADLKSPSSRSLDTLEVEIRNGAEVWVKFQNYRAGTAEKIPLT